MKYYETTYEDYINAKENFNLHKELDELINILPNEKNKLCNMIFYGGSGVGKYTQVLSVIKRYSPSKLKYDKKITVHTEKQDYNYHISDIHYEIDMSLLGCHSKMLWHEIFLQIVDIISMKTNKMGIIVCKNFHMIHNELLEIFYSYIQQYSNINSIINIYFIIITENISFLPNNILNACQIINIRRPSKEDYKSISNSNNIKYENNDNIENKLINFNKSITNNNSIIKNNNFDKNFEMIEASDITNIKEIKSFNLINENIPQDVFNIINNNIIDEMIKEKLSFQSLRDNIYDILIYNLDTIECIWYIIYFLITNNYLKEKDITDILIVSNNIFLQYNNNYRPIYHIENILLYIITRIKK